MSSLVLVVLLSAPAWLTWVFLSGDRRTSVLAFLDRLVEWVRALSEIR